MKRILITVGLITLLLASCSSAPEPTSVPTVTSTVTLTPTVTNTPEPTPTRFPTGTRFPTPTYPPIITATHTNTPYPTSTLPPFPTPEVDFWQESISSTGKWIAWRIHCNVDGLYACFRFINKDGSQIWRFPEDVQYVKGSLPYTVSGYVAHWSADNKFVYIVTRPDIWEVHFFPVFGIIKFSLVTGTYSYIITPNFPSEVVGYPLPEDMNVYEYGFSNNSQWLVYAIKNEHSLNFVIFDLYSGDTDYFSVIVNPESRFGDISWSPNDRLFVFSVAEHMDGLDTSDDFSVFRVMLEDLSVKRIYPHGNLFLYSIEWISNKEIKYDYLDLEAKSGEVILNIETGEVTEVEQ